MAKKNKNLAKKEAIKGFSISSIYLVYAAIFWGYPFVWLFILVFSKWKFVGKPQFVGFKNITRVLSDPLFWKTVVNVFRFMLYYIPLVLLGAMLFAIALNKLKYGKTFVTLSFLVANVSSGVAYSIMFSNLFAVNGPVNRLLYNIFGITIPWFSSPSLAMFSIALIVIWKFIGYYGLILYAGLTAIPESLYEAAELDGANGFTKFFKITLPLLNPSIVMVMVLAITLAFGIFTEPYMITGGGPMRSTLTPMMHMITTAFQRMDPTYAATMAVFVAGISFGMVWLVRKIMEREVDLV